MTMSALSFNFGSTIVYLKIIRYGDCRNFASWTIEKLSNAISGLADLITECPNIKNSDSFHNALYYNLLVYGYLVGGLTDFTENGNFAWLILDYGNDGFLFLKDLIYKSQQSEILKEINASKNDEIAVNNIIQLINENKKTNRTLIAVELSKIKKKDLLIQSIEEDIELVHQGEKSWEWFYNKHKLDKYYSNYSIDKKLLECYEKFY